MKAVSCLSVGLGSCVAIVACVPSRDAQTVLPAGSHASGHANGNAHGAEQLQVSDWGEEARGLQCRVAMPAQIEEGMPLKATVEMRALPKKLRPNVRVLNPCDDMCTFFSFHLENLETSQRFAIDANHRTFGPPPLGDKGEHAITLDGSPIVPWVPTFAPSRVEPKLKPASYRCFVRYAQPDEPTPGWHGTRSEWEALGAWAGTVESAPLTLRVLPETPKARTFMLPTRLRLVKKGWYPGDVPWLRTVYTAEDAEEVTVPVRNGHWVGTHVTDGYFTSISGGAPTPDDSNPIDQWTRYKGGDRKVIYKITLFETCIDNPRFVGRGACGYKVLWERTFDLHFTEAEIKAILAQ